MTSGLLSQYGKVEGRMISVSGIGFGSASADTRAL